jgi:hypothetical protein
MEQQCLRRPRFCAAVGIFPTFHIPESKDICDTYTYLPQRRNNKIVERRELAMAALADKWVRGGWRQNPILTTAYKHGLL